ncbi:MAG: hypothetical protein IPJ66_18170 [Bacteroidetes bacterium]|nr:hypothetical protein [Bacteroidota bacterium]
MLLQFDSSVSNRLDSAKLAGVWDRMVATAGPLKGVDSISPITRRITMS